MKETFKRMRNSSKITLKLAENRVWKADKSELQGHIIDICEEYEGNGDTMTLRQLYYQLVAKDLIPNHIRVYQKLSSLKDELCYAGHLDWSVFEDRGRVPTRAYFENSVSGALQRAVDYYALDRQLGQETLIEVWTEKDAISGILKKVTNPYTISLVVNKGYNSSTAMYEAYKRFCSAFTKGKSVKILYFGDHDPSGLDMIRDIRDRLVFMFDNGSRLEGTGVRCCYDFEVVPIGLTMEQIKEFNPPHNPAKITDPRAYGYIQQFGQKSWEVDALKPAVMREIVETNIKNIMDMDVYNNVLVKERNDIKKITDIIDNIEENG